MKMGSKDINDVVKGMEAVVIPRVGLGNDSKHEDQKKEEKEEESKEAAAEAKYAIVEPRPSSPSSFYSPLTRLIG